VHGVDHGGVGVAVLALENTVNEGGFARDVVIAVLVFPGEVKGGTVHLVEHRVVLGATTLGVDFDVVVVASVRSGT